MPMAVHRNTKARLCRTETTGGVVLDVDDAASVTKTRIDAVANPWGAFIRITALTCAPLRGRNLASVPRDPVGSRT